LTKIFNAGTVSGILLVLLLATVFSGAFNLQSAKANTSSPGQIVQATGTDWWPMFHHDPAHTGYSTSTGPTTNHTLWTYTTGGTVDSSPAVVGGFVYVGSDDNSTYCLNAATGKLVWSYKTGGGVYSSPAVAGGLVYVGSADYNVYCLDAATGKLVWNYTTPNYVGNPTVVGGLVYLQSSGNIWNPDAVYCLNAATGKFVWSYPVYRGFSSPAVAGGLVYIGDGSFIDCLDATTGNLVYSKWFTVRSFAWTNSAPAVVGGLIYIGSDDGNVYCLSATNGARLWNYTTNPNDWVNPSPAVAGGLVYVGSNDGNVYCLNALTGKLAWSDKTGNYVVSSPAVAGNSVYVGSNDNNTYCLNAVTGGLVWSYKTGGPICWSSPAVVNGVVYIGSGDGKIYAFGAVPALQVILESLQDTGATSNLGKIVFDSTSYSLPNSVSKIAGTYQAKYTAASSTYSFSYWVTSGGVSVSSKYANPTTVKVTGAGTLEAVYTTTIFSDGFESGNFSAWTGTSVSSGETATVVSTLKHDGKYSAKFTSNGSGGTENSYCYKTIVSSSAVYARAYFYVSQSGIVNNTASFDLIKLSGTSGDVAYAGWTKTGGAVKWSLMIRNGTTWATAYSTSTPSLNIWYCVELHWKESGTAGLGELFVNGARVCSITGRNTTAYGGVIKACFGLPRIYDCGSTTAYCDSAVVARTYVGPEYIFSDGFESGNFSAWTGTTHSSGETVSVTHSIAYMGSDSAMLTSNGNGGFEYASCYKAVSSLSNVYARGYFRVAKSGITANGDSITFVAFANASGSYPVYAGWYMTGGVVKWFLLVGPWIVYSTSSPSLNTWYSVELHWTKGTTTGLGELYVNGVKVCAITAANTAPYGSVTQTIFGLGLWNCASTTVYCDCTKIATNYIGPQY
jgi:outer membrane protein assembly factor BamB